MTLASILKTLALANEAIDAYNQIKDTLSSSDKAEIESALEALQSKNDSLFDHLDRKLSVATEN